MCDPDIPPSIGHYEVLGVATIRLGSTIFLARDTLTGLPLALKRFTRDDRHSSSALERELASLTGIFHPFTSCIYESIDLGDVVYLAIPWPPNGSLRDVIQRSGAMTEGQARLIVVQLLSVLEYLHFHRQVIFRNIRPRNIRFDEHHFVRLGDFSFCDALSSLLRRSEALPPTSEEALADLAYVAYTAPEILMEQPATAACDVWSLGVLLFEMVTGAMPFATPHLGRLSQKILREHPAFPRDASHFFCDLVRRMLEKDPNQRITLENIKQHPWISESDGAHFALNGSLVEQLRARLDPSGGAVDPAIVQRVAALGLDVGELPLQLLNGLNSDAASAYRQYVRAEMTRLLAEIVPRMLARQQSARSARYRDEAAGGEELPSGKIAMCVVPRVAVAVGKRRLNSASEAPYERQRKQSRSPVPSCPSAHGRRMSFGTIAP